MFGDRCFWVTEKSQANDMTISSLSKYLLSTYYAPTTVVGIECVAVGKAETIPPFGGWCARWGR